MSIQNSHYNKKMLVVDIIFMFLIIILLTIEVGFIYTGYVTSQTISNKPVPDNTTIINQTGLKKALQKIQ